ncbi:MAG: hypothetical protein K6G49_02065 [Candidatus Saccharibacteria bacterium]|nr:hypothetical protein [Candidatus Saccharibacteria bacterium]
MTVHLAEKYSSKMDVAFAHGSYTDKFVNRDYDFDGVQTINVYTPTTVATSNYNRSATGDRFGGNAELQDTVATYQLANDKCFKIAIDRGNYLQGALAKKAGQVLRAQMDEQVIPEIDTDRIATAATAASTNNQAVSYTAGSGNAYAAVLKASAYLDEAKAPINDRAMFVTPAFYNEIKKDITTGVYANGYNDKLVPRGFVGELDGMAVIKVPSTYFPANTLAVIWQKKAVLGARQIHKTDIREDSELVDGAVLTGRFIYDTFVLAAKKKAVASITGTTPSA